MTHNEKKSGVAPFLFRATTIADCLAMIRELIGFLPSNNLEDPPRRAHPADTPARPRGTAQHPRSHRSPEAL